MASIRKLKKRIQNKSDFKKAKCFKKLMFECVKCKFIIRTLCKDLDPADAICIGFIWEYSKFGHDYWQSVYYKLRKY